MRNVCPFCPLMLSGEPGMWSDIGNDFYGTPATIGGICACDDCAVVASLFEHEIPVYVAQVAERAEASYQQMCARMRAYIHYVQAHLEARHV